MQIKDYERIGNLVTDNVFLLDGPEGTKSITAKKLGESLVGLLNSRELLGSLNLSELTQINVADAGDKLLLGLQGGGVEAISAKDFLYALVDASSLNLRTEIARGKNLGTEFTAEQKVAIADGSFKGLFLGDYWEIDGNKFRIVDFDYFMRRGQINNHTETMDNHHIVIWPDGGTTRNVWIQDWTDSSPATNISNTTIHSIMPLIEQGMRDIFGKDSLCSFMTVDAVSVDGSGVSGIAWVKHNTWLPSIGTLLGAPLPIKYTSATKTTLSYYQLPRFRLLDVIESIGDIVNLDGTRSAILFQEQQYWTSDWYNYYAVYRIGSGPSIGGVSTAYPTENLPVRPIFCLKGG